MPVSYIRNIYFSSWRVQKITDDLPALGRHSPIDA
jgi:hypothetical protein